jgi:hypothetical protein
VTPIDGTPAFALTARSFCIATGSEANVPDVPGLLETGFWTSDDILDTDTLPASCLVLGGGAIALEMAHYLDAVGTRIWQLIREGVVTDWGSVAIVTRIGAMPHPLFFDSYCRMLHEGTRPGDKLMAPALRMPAHRAANAVVKAFLREGWLQACDTLLFVDDDHVFNVGTLEKLRSDPDGQAYDVLGAVYSARGAGRWPVIMRLSDKATPEAPKYGVVWDWEPGTVVPVDTLGLGFTLVRRSLLERMAFPWFQYRDDPDGTEYTVNNNSANQLLVTGTPKTKTGQWETRAGLLDDLAANEEIVQWSAIELSRRIHARDVSCVEVMEAFLAQIEELDSGLGMAFIFGDEAIDAGLPDAWHNAVGYVLAVLVVTILLRLGSLALQAVLIALGAVLLAAVIQVFLAPRFPLPVTVPSRAFWQIPLLAVVMALAAGAIGMRKVLRSDPSQAFSGAGA